VSNIADSMLANISTAAFEAGSSQPKPTKAEGAAKQFEALLINQMLKTARESGSGNLSGEDEDSEGGAMRDIADQQFSQLLANHGGLGLARILVKGLTQGAANANEPPPADPAELSVRRGPH
jgi:Rod binding domain-containing protein